MVNTVCAAGMRGEQSKRPSAGHQTRAAVDNGGHVVVLEPVTGGETTAKKASFPQDHLEQRRGTVTEVLDRGQETWFPRPLCQRPPSKLGETTPSLSSHSTPLRQCKVRVW